MAKLKISFFLLFISSFISLQSQDFRVVETAKISIQNMTIQDELYWAVTMRHVDGYHTYWLNPGDAGLSTDIQLFVDNNQIELEELERPAPIRIIDSAKLWAYAYQGEVTFFIRPPKNISTDENKNAKFIISWLACKEQCIPGKEEIEIKISNSFITTITENSFEVSEELLVKRFLQLPKKIDLPEGMDLNLTIIKGNKKLVLYYHLPGVTKKDLLGGRNFLTPFLYSPLNFTHEELYESEDGSIYGKLIVGWDGEYLEPLIPFPGPGRLKKPINLSFILTTINYPYGVIISKEFKELNLDIYKQIAPFYTNLKLLDLTDAPHEIVIDEEIEQEALLATSTLPSSESNHNQNIFLIIIFAILGGFILNFMPCVLPVISLKLFSLIKSTELAKKEILKLNLSYSLGVWFTFLILAGVVSLLKISGHTIGWGFHLQSPIFVATLIIFLAILTMNLFGLFDFATFGGKYLGNLSLGKGTIGSEFFTGIVSTILATPCSAPFLGTAIGVAFLANDNLTIFYIFSGIAFGLSLPFIILSFIPSLTKFLPRPGNWMNQLKALLALSMLFTTIWLISVFIDLTPDKSLLLQIHLLIATIFFYFFSKKNSLTPFLIKTSIVAVILMLLILAHSLFLDYKRVYGGIYDSNSTNSQDFISWEKWTPEKLKTIKDEQKFAFLNFTAKWCLTCHANEQLVFNTKEFQELVQKTDLKLLKADWTKKDPTITKWLNQYAVAGVPAYFIQKPNGAIVFLGETVSLAEIKKVLE